jgi:hypothetical protein
MDKLKGLPGNHPDPNNLGDEKCPEFDQLLAYLNQM